MRNSYFIEPAPRPRLTPMPQSYPVLVDEQWALYCGEEERTTLFPAPQEQLANELRCAGLEVE